jgi:putative cell wall-binding protein
MAAAKTKKWSQHVTETSNAMDLEPNVFKQTSAKEIAEDIEHDAEKSNRRKTTPYRSAMSMLTFYINRAGKNLSAEQRKVLEDAKDVLRAEFGPQPSTKKSPAKKSPTTKKSPAKKKTPSRKKTASRIRG